MNNTTLRIAATFMISLIITLPFYTSSVFAVADIREGEVSGDQSRINGFFGNIDTMIRGTVLAIIKNSSNLGQVLGPTEHYQVKLGYSNNFPDTTMCTNLGQVAEGTNAGYYNYSCEVEPSFVNIGSILYDGPYGPFMFGVFDIDGNPLAQTASIEFAVDTTPPKSVIDSISSTNMSSYTTQAAHLGVDYAIGPNSNLTGTYTVTDYSGYANGLNYRVGVTKVQLKINNQGLVREDVFSRRNVATGNINFNAYDFGDEGNNTICLIGTDALGNQEDIGQTVDNCEHFFIDISPPHIYYNEMLITDQNGRQVNYIKPGFSYKFSVIANISDDGSAGFGVGFSEGNIKMDLVVKSGDTISYVFRESSPECEETETEMKFTCTWAGGSSITGPEEATDLLLGIYGKDLVGNDMLPENSTANLEIDDGLPMLTGLWNVVHDIQIAHIGKNFPNTIVAVIRDTGAGVAADTVKANFGASNNGLHKDGAYHSDLNPDLCIQPVQGIYNCIWYNMTCPASCQGEETDVLEVALTITDTAGNIVGNTTELGRDFIAPVPVTVGEEANVTVVTDGGDRYYRSSNLFQFSFKTFDIGAGHVLASGDFSQFSQRPSDSNPIECGPISEEPGNFTCAWSNIQPLSQSFDSNIIFNASDLLGNAEQQLFDLPLAVLIDDDSPPSYYHPPNIDQEDHIQPLDMTFFEEGSNNQYQYPVFFTVPYNGQCSSEVGIVEIGVLCDGLHGESYSYDITYLMKKRGSSKDYEGVFNVPVSPMSLQSVSDTVEFSCTFNLYESCGSTFYTQPQVFENVEFYIPVLGGAGPDQDQVIEEIKSIKKTWADAGGWKILDVVQAILDFAKQMCKIGSIVKTVGMDVVGLFIVISGLCSVPVIKAFSFGTCDGAEATGGAIEKAIRKVLGAIKKITDTSCGIAGCQNVEINAFGIKANLKHSGWCDLSAAKSSVFGGYSGIELAQKSIIYSALCLCIPGIIFNLQKLRQNNCFKGVCYQDSQRLGFPKQVCDDRYAYASCVLYVGQVTAFAEIFNIVHQLFKILDNAFAWLWTRAKYWASKLCGKNPKPSLVDFLKCLPYWLMEVTEAAALLKNIDDSDKYFDWNQQQFTDFCSILKESTIGEDVE